MLHYSCDRCQRPIERIPHDSKDVYLHYGMEVYLPRQHKYYYNEQEERRSRFSAQLCGACLDGLCKWYESGKVS